LVDAYPEWAVTVAFYAALHWVNCYAKQCGDAPASHEDRNQWLQRTASMRPIAREYDSLRTYATRARYHYPPPQDDIYNKSIVGTRIFTLLGKVRSHVERELAKLL
jgi:hypothetical protein